MQTVVLAFAIAATAAATAGARHGADGLSVTAYRDHANAICATERRQAMAAYAGTRTLQQYLQSEVALVRRALASFRKLAPPTRLASVHASILSTVKDELALFRLAEREAAAGTLTDLEWQQNRRSALLAARERALWKKVGAATCAV